MLPISKIVISRIDLSGPSGYCELDNPCWREIEEFFEQNFRDLTGVVELSTVGDETTISIRGQSGRYVVEVESAPRSQFKVLTNSSTENLETLVPMCDGESLKRDTVDDLHQALRMVEKYVESGEFVDSEPYFWKDS